MNKAEKKFRWYAILVIFVLLTGLLVIINGVNFTMAAQDADRITEQIAGRQGSFGRMEDGVNAPPEGGFNAPPEGGNKDFRFGPMGPDSPEMQESIRYFTVSFSEKTKEAKTVAYQISSVTEDEAKTWAESLLKGETGWTRGTYRYRVYKYRGQKYVTVIDQARELLPSFRILLISAIGEAVVLLIGWFVLKAIGKKIYAPIREAERKQKAFLTAANQEFRVPLTVIGGNMELIERRYGPDEETRSTRRQLGKLGDLVDQLETFGLNGKETARAEECRVSEIFRSELGRASAEFASRGITLQQEIAPDVTLAANTEDVRAMIGELVGNALKYALTTASFALKKENGHVLIEAENDTDLPDGSVDQVFDRFTTLENAEGSTGLGLSRVKEIVKALNGRIAASVSGGKFLLTVTL